MKHLLLANNKRVSAEYAALILRARALGYSLPSAAGQKIGNDLVVGLKNAGIWNLLDFLYILATNGDANFALLNWKNPSLYQGIPVLSPVFTSKQGYNSAGAGSYLRFPFDFAANGVNYTQNAASIGATIIGNLTSGAVFGCADATKQVLAYFNGSNPAFRVNQNGGDLVVASNPDTGFLFGERTANNAVNAEVNGTTNTGSAASVGLVSGRELYGLAYNNNGTLSQVANTGVQLRMLFGGGVFNQATLKSLENTYFTQLSLL